MKRTRRITEKYRPHLAEIARLYIESGRNKSATERGVRKQLGLESFKADFLRSWERNAEFAALLKEAEDGQANAQRLRPSVRGPKRIAWLIEVEAALKTRHEDGTTDDAKDKALRALLNVGAEIRAEEAHYEAQQQARARRSFERFLRNVVAHLKDKQPELFPVVAEALADVAKHLDSIMDGKARAGVEA